VCTSMMWCNCQGKTVGALRNYEDAQWNLKASCDVAHKDFKSAVAISLCVSLSELIQLGNHNRLVEHSSLKVSWEVPGGSP